MGMPRRGRRRIVVGGRALFWMAVYGRTKYLDRCVPLRLIVELAADRPGPRLRAQFWSGRSGLWRPSPQAVTPAAVRQIIEAALAAGWRPGSADPGPFAMYAEPFLHAAADET